MSLTRVCRPIVVAFVLLAGMSDFAFAQTPLPLPGPDHEATGLRAGGFVMFPSVETGVVVTDNVSNAPANPQSDMGYFVAPSLRIESDWVRHSATIDASSRVIHYFDNPSEDETEFDIRAGTRIDVRSDTTLETTASYNLEQEGRGSIDVPGAAAEPPNEHSIRGTVGLTHEFNRLEVSVDGSVEYNIFEDVDLIGGGTQNNTDRNYVEYEGELRLGYNISPKIQPFVSASYSVRRHDEEIDDNGLRRDSEGVEIQGGVAVEFSSVLSGELAVGYVHRDFDDVTLQSIDGVTFDGNLTWSPTPITTVEFTASTNVEETGAGAFSGAIERSFGVTLLHELRYNLMLGGTAQFFVEDFTGGSLKEETLFLAASLTYQLNRSVALRASFSHESFNSSTPGADFDENLFLIGLLLQR